MNFRVSINGFKLLRPIAKKTKCRVRIVAKRGLPFILNKYRKRKTFIAGALIFLALLYTMTSFIWSIDITGNETLDNQLILDTLKENGIAAGTLKFGLDTRKAVSDIMLDMKELSWISLELKGTRLKVEIRERDPVPTVIPQNDPCSILASKDGLVSRIIVKEGIETVNVGDTVKKGQEVISGRIPVKNEKDVFRLVHAIGTVEARTWYEEVCPVETEIIEESRSGRNYKNYSLVLFSSRINLFHRKSNYEFYDKDELRKILTIGNDLVFPFEVIIDRYFEITPMTVEIDEEDARSDAEDKAYNSLLEVIPEDASIVRNKTEFETDQSGGTIARVTIECLEEIGVEQRIGGD